MGKARSLICLLLFARAHGLRLLGFGDSLTAGFVRPGDRLVPPMERAVQLLSESGTAATYLVEGKVGGSTFDFPQRLASIPDRDAFDAIVILGGTNDLWRLVRSYLSTCLRKLLETMLVTYGSRPRMPRPCGTTCSAASTSWIRNVRPPSSVLSPCRGSARDSWIGFRS